VAVARLGIKGAGRVLDIGKTTLYRKMAEYGISLEEALTQPDFVEAEALRPLLGSARTCADYLMRCVGSARALGNELDAELKKLEGGGPA
jgi:hypothetical protein